jgi:DNA-binding PadR family transcriptional regulator
MTVQTQAVLQALLADPHAELYGLEIAERTGLLPGTTYPILVRLQQIGWVRDRWEIVDPHDEQRPRRRYYQLTDQGVVAARDALHRTRARASRTASHLGMTVDGST